jgi:hypothetical protein
LRRVAEAADADGREWEWSGGYPQTVTRIGDAVLIANTFEGPDWPSTIAEFIATFDPPTVLALLAERDALVVERDRYRQALEEIAALLPATARYARIARVALGDGETPHGTGPEDQVKPVQSDTGAPPWWVGWGA